MLEKALQLVAFFAERPWLALLIALGAVALLILVTRVPFTYNLRNLVVRWPITAMTGLAFTMVVALLTVMLAFVNGMYQLTEASGIPGNVLVLSDGATDELFSRMSLQDVNNIELGRPDRTPILHNDKGKPLVSREVYIVVNQPIPAAPGQRRQRRFVQVRGIDDPELSSQVHDVELMEGGAWFSDSGVAAGSDASGPPAIQAVLGEGVAMELASDLEGKDQLEAGDRFHLGGREWVAVGVTKSAGSTFGSEIWAKRSIVGPMFGKESMITSVVLRTADADAADALADDLTHNFKESAVQAIPETEYYDRLGATNRQFLVAIVFVAVVLAVGGVFGVMNTMFAAISQRTRDIGVLRILGFSRPQILLSFFIESLVIALIGGAVGCAIGYLFNGWTATSIVTSGQGGGKSVVFRLVVDGSTLSVGMLFTLAMGAIGGLLPALSAMQLRPLDAVR